MQNVTLTDGGMGQELMRRSLRPPSPLWSADTMLRDASLVRDVHREFIDSGARVITLNTYSATPERLEPNGLRDQFENLHRVAVKAARDAVALSERSDVRIAGCLPPLVASYRPDVSPPYGRALESYRRIVALQAPHVDLFLCETMASIEEAKAAATAAKESGKPVWLALTVSDERPGFLRSGEALGDALQALAPLDVEATMLNCSQPEAITLSWAELAEAGGVIGAYANGFTSIAGLAPGGTVEHLVARRDLDPRQYADHAMNWVRQGATIVGGCCEVGPAHIAHLHERLMAHAAENS